MTSLGNELFSKLYYLSDSKKENPETKSIYVSIEIIKELPITLILRPFNFETFATAAYIYASQDLLEAAAAPSLFLVSIASVVILLVSKYILSDN